MGVGKPHTFYPFARARAREDPYGVESANGGADWTTKRSVAGVLAWPVADRLYAVTESGEVFRSPDGGRSLDLRGRIRGQPAALLAQGPDDLYVALHDGTIERSTDGGATWAVRSTP
jgi:hypothetical protein